MGISACNSQKMDMHWRVFIYQCGVFDIPSAQQKGALAHNMTDVRRIQLSYMRDTNLIRDSIWFSAANHRPNFASIWF